MLRLRSGRYRSVHDRCHRGRRGAEGIRPAVAADVPSVRAVTEAAYQHYIARIGLVPRPMEADHAADVAAGRVFVTREPVNGLVVVEAYEDHLLLDSIAVHPDAQGQAWAADCSPSWTSARVRSACPRSGSPRTQCAEGVSR